MDWNKFFCLPQDGEAGGITQQIGATNVPADAIMESTKMVKEFQKAPLNIPGMLIIDTPGHESFSNLRSRGSSLCDLAILVVDIMHGLEPQTIESIQLLKKRKTPFIVALNKVDRLFQWRTNPNSDIVNTLKKQQTNTQQEFQERVQKVVAEFAIQELNVCLFNENKDLSEYISMVPTSAITGDGMGNLLAYLCEYSQKQLKERLAFSEELQATVMEVSLKHLFIFMMILVLLQLIIYNIIMYFYRCIGYTFHMLPDKWFTKRSTVNANSYDSIQGCQMSKSF